MRQRAEPERRDAWHVVRRDAGVRVAGNDLPVFADRCLVADPRIAVGRQVCPYGIRCGTVEYKACAISRVPWKAPM